MRNKLLLTTALVGVAFALPAAAEVLENRVQSIGIARGDQYILEENSVVQNNKDNEVGGAFWISKPDKGTINPGELVVKNGVVFSGNEALYDGGAIANFGKLDVDGAKFTGNKSQTETADSQPIGGGAISLGIDAVTNIKNSEFTGNVTGYNGGAIATRRTINSGDISNDAHNNQSLTISDSVFSGNEATGTVTDKADDKQPGGNGGAIASSFNNVSITNSVFENNKAANNGGAVYNQLFYNTTSQAPETDKGGVMSFENVTFSNNIAGSGDGGAIYNSADGTVTLAGENIFSGNTANGELNDIHNAGTVSVADGGTLTLDGGISGEGSLELGADTVLNVKDTTTISNETTSAGTTVNLTMTGGSVQEIDLGDIFTNSDDALYDSITLGDNALYNFVADEDNAGKYTAAQKSADEVASALGASGSEAAAVLAVVAGGAADGNDAFNAAAAALGEAAQNGNGAAAREAAKMGADANPVVRTVETDLHNMIFSAVSDELNNAGGEMAGKSSGDAFKQVKVWIRGMFNHADHEATSKAGGFDSNTDGVAMGIDKQIDNATKLGLGYAYSRTDVSAHGRDTDVDTHTAFVYGQYKPADWYVNTVVAYNWSDYDEEKSVLGVNAGAKYDVESLGVQSMFGYETKLGGYDVTPEAGLRYMHISQDAYHDKLGNRTGADDSEVLTAVIGSKIAKDYALDCETTIRPELRAAVTYDLFEDGNNANVVLANGAAYRVNGEKLERLGFELGAKVATDVSDNWEVSAGWEGRFRKDYQDHTAMLNAKYKF